MEAQGQQPAAQQDQEQKVGDGVKAISSAIRATISAAVKAHPGFAPAPAAAAAAAATSMAAGTTHPLPHPRHGSKHGCENQQRQRRRPAAARDSLASLSLTCLSDSAVHHLLHGQTKPSSPTQAVRPRSWHTISHRGCSAAEKPAQEEDGTAAVDTLQRHVELHANVGKAGSCEAATDSERQPRGQHLSTRDQHELPPSEKDAPQGQRQEQQHHKQAQQTTELQDTTQQQQRQQQSANQQPRTQPQPSQQVQQPAQKPSSQSVSDAIPSALSPQGTIVFTGDIPFRAAFQAAISRASMLQLQTQRRARERTAGAAPIVKSAPASKGSRKGSTEYQPPSAQIRNRQHTGGRPRRPAHLS